MLITLTVAPVGNKTANGYERFALNVSSKVIHLFQGQTGIKLLLEGNENPISIEYGEAFYGHNRLTHPEINAWIVNMGYENPQKLIFKK